MIKNTYSLFGYFKLIVFFVLTKIFFWRARLVRFPIEIRGRKFMDLGLRLTTGYGCRFEAFNVFSLKSPVLVFGDDVQVNDYVHISAMKMVRIGNNVLMASHIYISDNSHGFYKGEMQSSPDESPITRSYSIHPVCIEDNVWIGEGVVIMPGVTIGFGSIIGANSTVTKSIPPYCIAVGQPAKIIKKYDFTSHKWVLI